MCVVRLRGLGSGLLAAAMLAAGAQAGAQAPLPPCDPASARAFTLVAPAALPIRYTGGFYLEHATAPYSSDPHWDSLGGMSVAVTMASGRTVPFGYPLAPDGGRDLYGRWPLRLEAGDGAAHITVTYTESRSTPGGGRLDCVRELSAVVQPALVEDARIRLARPRVRSRLVETSPGLVSLAVRVRVRGRAARGLAHPVRLDVYQGSALVAMHTTRARRGRLSALIRFRANAGQGLGRISVRARYPGDVDETWPCDDVLTTGAEDGCRVRLRAPRGVRRTSGHGSAG
jgi:hypothetical protein